MRFLAQVVVRDEPLTLAYVFMTDEDDDYVDTFEPDGGENAVVVQPGGLLPDGVRTQPLATGPGLRDDDGEPVELVVSDDVGGDAMAGDAMAGDAMAELDDADQLDVVRTSGEPQWLQADEHPGPGWRLAIQLDSGAVPASLAFGDAGVGYAFVNDDLDRGVFFWQGA